MSFEIKQFAYNGKTYDYTIENMDVLCDLSDEYYQIVNLAKSEFLKGPDYSCKKERDLSALITTRDFIDVLFQKLHDIKENIKEK